MPAVVEITAHQGHTDMRIPSIGPTEEFNPNLDGLNHAIKPQDFGCSGSLRSESLGLNSDD
jgi:hypothetical protein